MKKLFDYRCEKCNNIEEKYISDATTEVVTCSKCGGQMVRLLSSPGMVKTNFADKPGFKIRK